MVTLSSCSESDIFSNTSSLKEATPSKTLNAVGLRLKTDKLYFESRKELVERISEIQSDSTLKKDLILTMKSQNFKSLYSYYQSFDDKGLERLVDSKDVETTSKNNFLIVEELNEPTLVEAVDLDEVQMLLNENSQIQVGDEIYTFNYDEVNISDLQGSFKSSEKIVREVQKEDRVIPLASA